MPPTSIPRSLAHGVALACLAIAGLIAPVAGATLYALGGNQGPSGGQSALYTLDDATGVMTWVGSLHTAGSFDNTLYNGGLAYDPGADRMYGLGCDSSGTSALFLVDRTDASMVRLGYCYPPNTGAFCSGGLAFDITSGRLFAVGDLNQPPYQRTSLVELNPLTGAATVLGDHNPAGTYLSGLGADPQTGILYANGNKAFESQSALFTLDKNSGAAMFVGYHGLTLGRQMKYSGLAVNPVTGTMYGFGSFSGSQNNLYTVNKATGTAVSVAPATPNGIGVDGALVYVGTDILAVAPGKGVTTPLRAWPNPARSDVAFAFSLEQPGTIVLALHDVAGRRVASVPAGELPAGSHVLRWNGLDSSGARLPAGLCFATLRDHGVAIGRTSVLVAR